MSARRCHVCGRSDVRLYRGYRGYLSASEITCNDHLPLRRSARSERRYRARFMTRGRRDGRRIPPMPPPSLTRSAWRVPLIEAPDGSVWGYLACPQEDIDTWGAKPDASEYAPHWRLESSGWTDD